MSATRTPPPCCTRCQIRALEDQFDEFLVAVTAELTPEQASRILTRYKFIADHRGWLSPAPSCVILPSN